MSDSMAERQRKKVSEKVSKWDQFTTLVMPGDIADKRQKLNDMADANERAELEAIRQKRMNAGR